MQNLASSTHLDVEYIVKASKLAAQADSSGLSEFDASLVLPPPHSYVPSTGAGADVTIWLSSPLGMATSICLALLLFGSLLWSAWRKSIEQAVAAAQAAQEAEANKNRIIFLEERHEHLLSLLQKRDRYMVQYEGVLPLGEEAYANWIKRAWKTIALNQLAMTKAVRPLVYADYRSRVRVLSASYATQPGPVLTALREQLARTLPLPEVGEEIEAEANWFSGSLTGALLDKPGPLEQKL